MEQLLGEFFVLSDGLCNRTGGVNLSRLNAALLAAPAQLDQAAFGQATVGDATRNGGVDDRACGWAQANIFVEFTQLVNGGIDIEARVVECSEAKLMCQLDGHDAHLLFGVFHGHLEQTMVSGGCGAAEGDGAARLNLQMQGGRFEGMRHAELDLVVRGLQIADAWE